MKKSRILTALALSACMAVGTVSFAACKPKNNDTTDTRDPQIVAAYELYAKAAGDDAMTYEEWLLTIKGEKGDDGAKGDKGDKGDAGKDGNGWLVGTTAPTAEEGNDGDLYLDYTTWNVYHKQSGAWVLLGNIKGEKGDKGEDGENGGSQGEQNQGYKLSVAADGTADMPIANVSEGVHIIEADFGSATFGGKLQAKIGEGVTSELLLSTARSTEGHNVYYGYIQVAAEDTAITFSASGEAVEATVTLKDWEVPTLSADGNPVEMAFNVFNSVNAVDENAIKIKLDSSVVAGNYVLTISGIEAEVTRFWVGSIRKTITATNFANSTVTIAASDLSSSGDTYIYLAAAMAAGVTIRPVTVTLTPAVA